MTTPRELRNPRSFASPRECLETIFSYRRARQWLTHPFDPQRSPINTQYFSMAFYHSRGTKEDFWTMQNVVLPQHIDQELGFAYILNVGKTALDTNNKNADPSSTILSRTAVVTYKDHNRTFDCIHYADSTVGLIHGFRDDYGARHVYVFRLRKKEDGELDLDHPLKVLYEIGKPDCEYCKFFKDTCQCSYEDAERTKVKVTQKPCKSFDNFVTMISKVQSTETRVYAYDDHNRLQLITAKPPQQCRISRVSAWDYIGPNILADVIPIGANLISDHFNALSASVGSKVKMLLNLEDSTITSMESSGCADQVRKRHCIHELTDSVNQLENSYAYRVQEIQDSDIGQFADYQHTIRDENSHGYNHVQPQSAENVGLQVENLDTDPVRENQQMKQSSEEVIQVWTGTQPQASGEMQRYQDFSGAENIKDLGETPVKVAKKKKQTAGRTRNWQSRQAQKCPYCVKILSSKSNMKKHVNAVHERTKVMACEICGMEFYQQYNLNRHRNTNHGSDR